MMFTFQVNGRKVRGRKYPWGVVEVENVEHCDFIALRNLLIRTHMQVGGFLFGFFEGVNHFNI